MTDGCRMANRPTDGWLTPAASPPPLKDGVAARMLEKAGGDINRMKARGRGGAGRGAGRGRMMGVSPPAAPSGASAPARPPCSP